MVKKKKLLICVFITLLVTLSSAYSLEDCEDFTQDVKYKFNDYFPEKNSRYFNITKALKCTMRQSYFERSSELRQTRVMNAEIVIAEPRPETEFGPLSADLYEISENYKANYKLIYIKSSADWNNITLYGMVISTRTGDVISGEVPPKVEGEDRKADELNIKTVAKINKKVQKDTKSKPLEVCDVTLSFVDVGSEFNIRPLSCDDRECQLKESRTALLTVKRPLTCPVGCERGIVLQENADYSGLTCKISDEEGYKLVTYSTKGLLKEYLSGEYECGGLILEVTSGVAQGIQCKNGEWVCEEEDGCLLDRGARYEDEVKLKCGENEVELTQKEQGGPFVFEKISKIGGGCRIEGAEKMKFNGVEIKDIKNADVIIYEKNKFLLKSRDGKPFSFTPTKKGLGEKIKCGLLKIPLAGSWAEKEREKCASFNPKVAGVGCAVVGLSDKEVTKDWLEEKFKPPTGIECGPVVGYNFDFDKKIAEIVAADQIIIKRSTGDVETTTLPKQEKPDEKLGDLAKNLLRECKKGEMSASCELRGKTNWWPEESVVYYFYHKAEKTLLRLYSPKCTLWGIALTCCPGATPARWKGAVDEIIEANIPLGLSSEERKKEIARMTKSIKVGEKIILPKRCTGNIPYMTQTKSVTVEQPSVDEGLPAKATTIKSTEQKEKVTKGKVTIKDPEKPSNLQTLKYESSMVLELKPKAFEGKKATFIYRHRLVEIRDRAKTDTYNCIGTIEGGQYDFKCGGVKGKNVKGRMFLPEQELHDKLVEEGNKQKF